VARDISWLDTLIASERAAATESATPEPATAGTEPVA
jgi:hypothetical protein